MPGICSRGSTARDSPIRSRRMQRSIDDHFALPAPSIGAGEFAGLRCAVVPGGSGTRMSKSTLLMVYIMVIWFVISFVTNLLGPLMPIIIGDFHLSLRLAGVSAVLVLPRLRTDLDSGRRARSRRADRAPRC